MAGALTPHIKKYKQNEQQQQQQQPPRCQLSPQEKMSPAVGLDDAIATTGSGGGS